MRLFIHNSPFTIHYSPLKPPFNPFLAPNPVQNTKTLYWRLCCLKVVMLSVLAFTPLVIPPGRYEPMLAGMPLTLWAGIGIACALVALTYVGARVHPDVEDL